jgi:hypothetical protein
VARNATNSATVALGANAIAGVTDIKYEVPSRTEIVSNVLNEDVPNVVGVGSRGSYKLTISVEVDKADTNGQVALDVLYGSKASGTVNYYPEGNSTGNKKYAGSASVVAMPGSGGQGKDKVKSGDYVIIYDGAPAITTI